MQTESLLELISLCRQSRCAITLEANSSGVVAKVSASRGDVALQTSVWLDANDETIGPKLDAAILRVQ